MSREDRGLVYVAAFVPGDGQSLVDLTNLPEGAGDMVRANMVVDGDPPVATMPAAVAARRSTASARPSRRHGRSSSSARRLSPRS